MTATTTKTVKAVNYTAEQTVAMVAAYVAAPTKETVETLAVSMGKTVRSIVAKLSREKVYVAKEYTSKTGEKVEKKDTTADAIGAVLRLSEADIESLTKANKSALRAIFVALASSKPIND
jgi:response regulator RpfG family c-di-GMP phosphodiesterase